MYIIVGLGNPERRYDGTRHNIGFSAVTALADIYGISMDMKKHRAVCGKGVIDGQKVILAMPQTYMNLSGESVRELVEKKEAKKAEEKKAEKKEKQDKLKEAQQTSDDDDTITISAGSIEELIKKINDYTFSMKSNNVQTEAELQVGQHIDFRG